MSDKPPLYNSVAPLRNVTALCALIERVQERSHGLPGMATFYGPSGWGKTTAAIYAANHFDAYQVQLKSTWGRKKLVDAIATEMSIRPKRTVADVVDQIAEQLAQSGKPLLIDEADYLLTQSKIEIARDIYESSGSAVILIGEEQLPQNLRQWERVHGRMLDWVGASPGTIDDVGHLAPIYCHGIELAGDLKARVLDRSSRSIRRICVNLDRLREVAHTRGVDRLALADVKQGDFFTGQAPAPRKAAS